MSIAPIGSVNLQSQLHVPAAAPKSESTEVPGAPDHDGDADDGNSTSSGTVSVKA